MLLRDEATFQGSRTQPWEAAVSAVSSRGWAVLCRPLVPAAAVPTRFQTFNLLTLQRPWEAGKVVLSSFYSGETQVSSIQILSKLAAEVGCAAPLSLPRCLVWAQGQLSASHFHLSALGSALSGASLCPSCPPATGTCHFCTASLTPCPPRRMSTAKRSS